MPQAQQSATALDKKAADDGAAATYDGIAAADATADAADAASKPTAGLKRSSANYLQRCNPGRDVASGGLFWTSPGGPSTAGSLFKAYGYYSGG